MPRTDECRRAASEGQWAAMPHPIMDLIFYSVHSNDIRSILQLRLVCKAWRDAFAYFGGAARLSCKAGFELQQACNILPSLGNLSVRISEASKSITAISTLSLLSRLEIENRGARPLCDSIDTSFDCVPLGLKCLHLNSTRMESTFIQHIQSDGLRELSLNCPSFEEAAIDALQNLRSLQDLSIQAKHQPDEPRTDDFLNALRCGSLTRLILQNGCLPDGIDLPLMPPQLRDISLEDMTLDEQLVCKMAIGLPFLTKLDIADCTVESMGTHTNENLGSLTSCASSSLRDLRVMDSPSFLLCVAGAKVESLIHGVYSWEPVNVPKLASMTALTRLRLLDFTFNPSADMRPLQELNLIELALLGCLGVTAALFKPGAFRALQTLNVEEDFDNLLDADGEVIDFPQQPSSQLVSHYHQLGRAVFGLPSLIELSGENRFSSLEVPEKHLLGWQKCISSNGPSVDGVHEVWRRVPSVW